MMVLESIFLSNQNINVYIKKSERAPSSRPWRQRFNVGEIRNSDTKAVLNNITDVNGLRIELAALGPESMHRQAMHRWK